MNLPRFLRTARHFGARQLVAQLNARRKTRWEDPARLLARMPTDDEQPAVGWKPVGSWPHPDGTPNPAEEVCSGRLTFIGLTREVGFPPRWSERGAPRLWSYNLHYHGFLFGLDAADARVVVSDYIEREGPGRKREGWEPYPLSLRLMNWVALFFGRWRDETLGDPEFSALLWLEVRRMARWLESHLEKHLRANHLLENAIALSVAGACFQGPEAERWLARGLELLRVELPEQILADGGHIERSPMYQARLLSGFCMLLNTGDDRLRVVCGKSVASMAGWLRAMTHPDGGIALFNDAAEGIYPRTGELLSWLAALGVEPRESFERGAGGFLLRESGYFVADDDAGNAFFMDVGEIGPDYQPGHAHADFLAIELSLGGVRFIVDGGVKEYAEGSDRSWSRSVLAHSTVFVDGEEPLELWGAFRVGRRGRPMGVKCETLPDGTCKISAAHDGYRWLPGAPHPQRAAHWSAPGLLHLADEVRGTRELACTSQLRITSDWSAEQLAPGRVRFTRAGSEAWVLAPHAIRVSPSRWFPRFGVELPAHLLQQRLVATPAQPGAEWIVCAGSQLARAEKLLARRGTAEYS